MDAPKSEPGLTLTFQPYGRSGGAAITITLPDATKFTDRVIVTDATKRAAFQAGLLGRYPGIDQAQIEEELERIAGEVMSSLGASRDEPPSHATAMVALVESVEGVELFHTPGGHDSEGYASIGVNGHRETWAINSRAFKRWLSRQFYLQEGAVPAGQAMSDAVNVLAGKAIHDGPEYAVHVRLARHGDEVWLDLGDKPWRAVRVTAAGWSVVEHDIPVRFIRKRGMLALPAPVPGGSINQFRSVVNLPDDAQWTLAVSWLVAALRPGFPFTLLNINGEQGSAKSTLSKMCRSLIDPATPLLRRPPKDDRDLMIAAHNSGVVAYDNISGLSAALSDSLCSLATGGGFASRELYSDDSEKLFDATRPVLINGIDDAVTKADLLDRSININLPKIADDQRRDEQELWVDFESMRPAVLGALLTAVSAGIRNLPNTKLSSKPRMADFALFVSAAEEALPWAAGDFMRAYRANRDDSTGLALEASPVGSAIMAFIEDVKAWKGTAGALLAALTERFESTASRAPKDWPASRKAMGNELRRVAPALRAMGLLVTIPRGPTGHKKERIICLEVAPGPRSAPSAWPAGAVGECANGVLGEENADHAPVGADDPPPQWSARMAPPNGLLGQQTHGADHADLADHLPGLTSKRWERM